MPTALKRINTCASPGEGEFIFMFPFRHCPLLRVLSLNHFLYTALPKPGCCWVIPEHTNTQKLNDPDDKTGPVSVLRSRDQLSRCVTREALRRARATPTRSRIANSQPRMVRSSSDNSHGSFAGWVGDAKGNCK